MGDVDISQLRMGGRKGSHGKPRRYAEDIAAKRKELSQDIKDAEKESQPPNIGMHPGIKPHHFFELGIDRAMPRVQDLFEKKVDTELSKLKWLNKS